MQKTFKKALIRSILLNLLAGAVAITPFFFLTVADDRINWGAALLIIAALSLFIQAVIGIIYITEPAKKHIGQAMLLSVGIYFVIAMIVLGPLIFEILI